MISYLMLGILILGYLSSFIAWIYFSRANKKALFFGAISVIFIAPVVWAITVFSWSEHYNACYSSALEEIGKIGVASFSSGEKEQATQFIKMVKELPLSGYETQCLSVLKVIYSYSHDSNLRKYGATIKP
jgi:hypothetical protein